MKICLINDRFPPEITGVGNYIFSLAKKMQARNNEIIIITSTQDKSEEGFENRNGLKIYKVHAGFPVFLKNYLMIYNPQTVRKVKAIFKKEKPDVSHFFNVHERLSCYLLKISKKYSKSTFWYARDVMSFSYTKLTHFINFDISLENLKKVNYKLSFIDLLKQGKKRFNPFRNYLIRHYLNYADELFSVSDALKNAMQANGITKKIRVIRSGIDVVGFEIRAEEVEEFKKKHGLQNKKILFLSGRLSGEKGVWQALAVLEKVIKKRKDVVLFLVGKKDAYMEEVLFKASQMGIKKNIITSGWLDRKEIKKAFVSSDIVLNFSLCLDAFPKVNLEAMAARKPMVATIFGGTPEVVVDGETGFLVNPLNTSEIANKILDLVNNTKKAERFGLQGRKRIEKYFNLEDKVDEILKVYKKYI